MSLNGLDAQPVTDAYYAAIVEVGGWFLLKYTSRDSVELLARGKGGVHEARNELLKYEEKSPLYGLIIYRRRKVLIKYIPDGTSRLLQARTAVHFQDVAERYAPYETVLEISHPDEFSDTSLASSFPLHTASPALSNTRLDEISEDAEDGGAGASFSSLPARSKSNTSAKFGTTRYKAERRVDQLMRAQQGRPSSPFRSADGSPNLSSSPSAGTKPSMAQFLVREDSRTRSITSLTPSVASVSEYSGSRTSLISDASTAKETETAPSTADLEKPQDLPPAQEDEPVTTEPVASVHAPSIREPSPERPSEASNRPRSTFEEDDRSTITSELSAQKSIPERTKSDLEEPFDFSYLEPKKKIKLGPRPVAATPEKPRKSGTGGTSLLPAAYRSSKKQEQQRPTSSIPPGSASAHTLPLPANFPAPPPIPDIPEYNPRPVSRGSVKSMPSQKSSTMTPEKLRLLKAVELRKKQMRKSNPQMRTPAPVEITPEVPKLPENAPESALQAGDPSATEQGLPEKLDSGIDLEGERQAEIVRQTSKPLENARSKGDTTREQQPAGLLSAPSAQTYVHQDITQLSPSKADSHTQERVLDEQQQAGAEDSTEANDALLNSENMFSNSAPAQNEQAVEAPRAEVVAPIPTNNIQPSKAAAVDQSVDETAFSTCPEDLITGVPVIVTTSSSRPQTAEDSTAVPRERSVSPLDNRQASGTGSSVSLATPTEEATQELSDLAKRRRGLVEPLHIDVDTNRNSVAESLSENDFLEELQSATFHDARQLSVSKSPGPSTPYFPRNSSYDSAGSQSRSPVRQISISNGLSQTAEEVSNKQPQQPAVHNNDISQESEQLPQSGQRSPDSISLIDGQSSNPSSRRNVSSGIQGRIQALNELSNREPNTVPVHIPTRGMSPDQSALFFANERKAGVRSPHSRTGSAFRLRPNVERAASNGVQQPEGTAPVWSTTHDTTSNRNSVSVKARIVRPNDGNSDHPTDPSDLHESQIEINHLRGIPTPTSVSQAFLPPMPTPPAEPASPDHRSLHSLRRKSLGRSKASTPAPTEDNRPASPPKTSTEEQSGSRTSRFFKRMSTFGSSSKRRSIAGPSAATVVNPTDSPSSRAGSVSTSTNTANTATATATVDRDTPPAVQVGDLNVQFPDTLLWKRRWLSLDDTGHLHLSPPTSQQPHHLQPRPGKRFHLSDFKAPYAPDLDQQELPHSICLEFTGVQAPESDSAFVGGGEGIGGGGVLQVACEDAMGQRQVLKLLGGYWRSWVEPAK